MLPPLDRLPGVMSIVDEHGCFVLHAARQTGKTTIMQTLVDANNTRGEQIALYFTVESAQPFVNPAEGIPKIVSRMRSDLLLHSLFSDLVKDPASPCPSVLPVSSDMGIKQLLSLLAQKADKPLVVFFDEVDSLSDGTLIAFLRELRDGYVTRATIPFPYFHCA